MLEEVLKYQGKNGLIGGYARIVTVIESMYLNIKYPYEGHIADGRYWDTLLAASALLSAGENP